MNSVLRISPGWTAKTFRVLLIRHPTFLVEIHDLYVKSIPIPPQEADTVLIVDANAVLSRAVSAQCLQMITRWHPQIIELDGRIQDGEFLESSSVQISGQVTRLARPPEPFRLPVPETRQHDFILTPYDTTVKH